MTVVFLDIGYGQQLLGRIKIKLFSEDLPRTCENFRSFCTGEYRENGIPIGYKNCRFHRLIKGFMIQGGDFIHNNGTGSKCIFGGQSFKDEGFQYDHKRYRISMANSGPNSNGCQFFICFGETKQLDGKHVVFGEVIEGFEIIDKLETVPTDRNDRPTDDIVIKECGEM